MKVYEATVIDKEAGSEPISYESHIVVDDENDGTKATDWELFYKDYDEDGYMYVVLKQVKGE